MSVSTIACALAAIVLVSARPAHADLLIGDFRATDGVGPVLRYDAAAQGAAAPTGAFYTNFGSGANGNVAPDRVIVPNGASFVLPQGITTVYDELFRNGFN